MTFAALPRALEGSTAFDTRWVFTLWDPCSNDRRSSSDVFSVDDLVECVLREAFQNILDSGSGVMRIRFVKVPYKVLCDVVALDELVERGAVSMRRFGLEIDGDGMVPCLYVEDEGCGLGGPYKEASIPGEKPGGLQSYLRGLGNTSKDDGAAGSKGQGRTGIMRASSLNTVIVETKRKVVTDPATGLQEGGETLVFGLSYLDHHVHLGTRYLQDGRFMRRTKAPGERGDPLLPYIDEEGREITRLLGCGRPEGVDGTTQFYPSIRPEVTFHRVVAEAVKNHFIAVLRGLKVEVSDFDGRKVVIDSESLPTLAADVEFEGSESRAALVDSVARMLDAMKDPVDVGEVSGRIADHPFAPDVLEALKLDLASGKPVCLSGEYVIRKNNYKGRGPCSGRLTFGVATDRRVGSGLSVLARGGIILVSQSGAPGTITMSLSENDPVHHMLRSGEDVSHTKWAPSKMAEEGWPLAAAKTVTWDFKNGAKAIYEMLAGLADETENDSLADIFGIPDASSPPSLKSVAEGKGPKPEPEAGPSPERGPHRDNDAALAVESLARDAAGRWGVSVTHSQSGFEEFQETGPGRRMVGFLYAQAEGSRSTWGSHSPADFSAHDFEFEAEGCTWEVIAENVVAVDIEEADFRLSIRAALHPDRMLRVAEVKIAQD